jgi:hypothetical protein
MFLALFMWFCFCKNAMSFVPYLYTHYVHWYLEGMDGDVFVSNIYGKNTFQVFIWWPALWCSFHRVIVIVFKVTLFLLHEKTIPCIACTDIWFDISLYSFDQFHIIRQGLLLSIDTFGVSHILPVLSLPFIALVWCNTGSKDNKAKGSIINSLTHSGGAPGVANCGRRHTSDRRKTHTLGTVAHCSDTVYNCFTTVLSLFSLLATAPFCLVLRYC